MVTLGPDSAAIEGLDDSLETLKASVNAFTRAWLGVREPSALSLTDDLAASPELLAQLDRALQLPAPHLGWDF